MSSHMHGMGGKSAPSNMGKGAKTPMKTLKRLLSYTFSRYKAAMEIGRAHV